MPKKLQPPGERAVLAVLILLTLLFRLPFVSRFDLVSFDGTYYINQAKALLHGSLAGGSFPIGYPLLIAPVLAVVRDGVLAAALVSLLAATGSVIILHSLARRHVAPWFAFGAALLLSASPLFIDASLATLSESAYVFWVVLALWFYDARQTLRAGLSLGMAAATRPEALAIALVLGLLRVRAPRQMASFALAFALLYGINIGALSVSHGQLTLLSRAGAYKSVSTAWSLRESSVDYQGREEVEERIQAKAKPYHRARSYVQRLPRDLGRLGRHALPALPGLVALYFVYGRRRDEDEPAVPWFVLAALAPLPLIPLFTEDRGIVRWLVPYLAPLYLLAAIGLCRVHNARTRALGVGATAVCLILSFAMNQRAIGRDIEADMRSTRDIARAFASRVQPGDAIADRKPYFAFYAGARYHEIPIGPYNDVIADLARTNVRYLALHAKSIHTLRPAMRPLVYDRAVVRGEMRFRQIQFEPSGEIIYERRAAENPLAMRRITTPETADHSPAWSPDGATIAFRRHYNTGHVAVMLMDSSGENLRELVEADATLDPMAWSPDGKRIVFTSTVDGRMVLNVCDVAAGRSARLSTGTAQQWNPSWCGRTGDLLLSTDLRGSPAIFKTGAGGRSGSLMSKGEPADLGSISPSGAWISWVDPPGRLVVLDTKTGAARKVRDPLEILSSASWSPDEAQVLVEAFDWGAPNVYMIDIASGRSLRVTASTRGDGMPVWSPDGDQAVVVSGRDGQPALWMLSNLKAYVARLNEPDDESVFERPQETRKPAPPGARRFRETSR